MRDNISTTVDNRAGKTQSKLENFTNAFNIFYHSVLNVLFFAAGARLQLQESLRRNASGN